MSEKTVADSMRRQGLVARRIKRRNRPTRHDKTAAVFPDLLERGFAADRPNARWVGDMTEVATAAWKLHLATMIDLYSRRSTEEPKRVVFHTDRGSTYTAKAFTKLCRQIGVRKPVRRVGSCFDNAAEAFFISLEREVLSRHEFADTRQAQALVLDWYYGSYNHQRRHSAAGMMSPVKHETAAAPNPACA